MVALTRAVRGKENENDLTKSSQRVVAENDSFLCIKTERIQSTCLHQPTIVERGDRVRKRSSNEKT